MPQTTATVNHRYYIANVSPALWQHAGLSLTAKAVATVLLMHRNTKSNLCYPEQELIWSELGVSESTVIRALKELRKHGLITWEARKAPKGKAKLRANSYDLTGLLQLCEKPITPAADLLGELSKMIPGELSKMIPHQSDIRPITDNRLTTVLEPTSESHGGSLAEDEDRTVTVPAVGNQTKEAGELSKMIPHSARTAMLGPLAGLTAADIRQKLLAPDGTSSSEVCVDADAYFDAKRIVEEHAGGEPFNPGDLGKLCDTYGNGVVWWQARWFLRRIASMTEPVRKPTALFRTCVEKDSPVNPTWPEPEAEFEWRTSRMTLEELQHERYLLAVATYKGETDDRSRLEYLRRLIETSEFAEAELEATIPF
jgi:predicted transcriptional regulator